MIVWLLGPTAAGKTTIAEALARRLRDRAVPVIHFDGDEVRDWFGPELGFAADDRLRVVRVLVDLANKGTAAGLTVVVSALTAHDEARAYVRQNLENLITAYITCSVETSASRDPKGLYAQARRGEIDTLIGYDAPYPPPDDPDLVIDTERLPVADAVRLIEGHLDGADDGRRTA